MARLASGWWFQRCVLTSMSVKRNVIADGGFRPDATFGHPPAHSAEVLTEAFRRGVLKLFVDRERFEPEVADGMLGWRHSGFSVHDGAWLDPLPPGYGGGAIDIPIPCTGAWRRRSGWTA